MKEKIKCKYCDYVEEFDLTKENSSFKEKFICHECYRTKFLP